MKTINCFYFLFIFSLLFFCSYQAEDTCPNGMRKLYVDNTSMKEFGSARKYMAAVCFFQFPGSLFFSRKVLIEPRFEVHLKATTDPVDIIERTREQKLYGFTIVISGYKNTISGLEARSYEGDVDDIVFEDIGYNNFVNSLIIEFDFEKDTYDPDSSSFSVRFCEKSCQTSSDRNAIYSARLNSQRYDPTKVNNWDFRLIYDTNKLSIYSGPNEVIFSKTVNLEEMLGTNIAFVGFTGFMECNRREISLIGSFICEDNYEISKMPGNFLLNNNLYETATYEAGSTINYLFSFINNKDQTVPHTYGYNIWNYTFTLNTDCGEVSYAMNKETNYTLILQMRGCTKAGRHALHINEENKGDAPERYYTVVAGPLKYIILIGHDGVIDTVPMKPLYNYIYLAYGESIYGDFVIKDNLKLVLDFKMTDQYENEVDVSSPKTLFTIKKIESNSESVVTQNILTYDAYKVGNHYQLNLNVLKVGTYQIEANGYMVPMDPIRFTVIPGEASPSTSYCTLRDYTSAPSLVQNKDVYYNCYLRDEKGNEIDVNTFVTNSKYEFSCKNQRTKPSSKTYSTTIEDKGNYYSCYYKTSDNGIFEINGYLTQKGTSQSLQITPKINQFSVRGSSDSLILKKVFDQYDKKWIEITNSVITYANGENNRITVLDLAESDGVTLISSYGNYPADFDVNKITAELYTYHDMNYKFTLQPKKETIDGKEYIALYPLDSDKSKFPIIKKSSFEYYIKVRYENNRGGDEKIVTIKYLLNIGSYQTCFHDMEISKTVVQLVGTNEIPIGSEKKFAKVELKTTDYFLHNENENLEFRLAQSNGAIQFRIVPLSIEGTYDVYAKGIQSYSGNVNVYVNNQYVTSIYITAQPSLACTLEFLHPEDFQEVDGPGDYREKHYRFVGSFTDGNLQFYFKLFDKFGSEILKDDYFDSYMADIYSVPFGNADYKYLTIKFDNPVSGTQNGAYNFRDNLPYQMRDFEWVLFMRDSSCNNKYHIYYDGMRGGSAVDPNKSYYVLLQNEIKLKEVAYVDVFLKDQNDQFMGLQENKLQELYGKVKVIATNVDNGDQVTLPYDLITSNYAIRCKKDFTKPGTYTITATYDGNELKCTGSNKLVVIDNEFSLEHSLLKLILDSVIDMYPDVRVTIHNTVQQPVYKLYFYSSTGVKIDYDGETKFTCKMTGNDTDLELDVNYNSKDYVQFTYKDKDLTENGDFRTARKGNYELKITSKGKTKVYLLYLLGDGTDDASNKDDYDITKTYVYPTHIDGIAGKTYSINVELRASDGLRWKKKVDTSKFKVENSYNLGQNQFTYKVEQGYKNGQAIISVTQYKVTEENKDNYLTLYYENNQIPQQVTLTIKCGDFAKLVYESGPSEGNVITPPVITFRPEDSYGNLYTDLFTNPQSQDYLNSLTIGKSTSEEPVPLTPNNYLEDNRLKVQYKSTISTDVKVTSPYFTENYPYRIWSGPIDPEVSYAELINTGANKVGSKYTIIIYPKDKYGNDIDTLCEEDMNKFLTYYEVTGSTNKTEVKECSLLKEGESEKLRKLIEISEYENIECHTSITKTGNMAFHVDYIKDEIECRNCQFFIISDTVSFKNTKTLYKNKNYYLSTQETNEIQGKVEPIFELTFFDEYLNQIGSSIVQKLDIKPIFSGADIKLCISNSNEKKIITLCPATDGDDNVNKWQYITNGDKYKLILEINDKTFNNIEYPLKITGGSEGSSDPEDFTKTTFQPSTIEIVAGEEGQTIMTINTADGIRKNYWYPNPSEKIKVEFDKDKDTCSYKVEYGDLPGKYAIKVMCTKSNDNNAISVTVDSNKINTKVKVIVKSGPAYYLEVEEPDKFTVSSDKYTWKTNPTNDDTISFLFKLKDKYLNYITTSVIGKGEITITSETFGSSDKYYALEFKTANTDYLFTDKIDTVITKHIWNIVCEASGRQYSFIYTKVAGKPDPSQSSWTIDKTAYIVYETSTVLVTLRDRLGVNVGTVAGKLEEEKNNLIVVATDSASKDFKYDFNSITTDKNLKYLNSFKNIGKYKVSVTYNGKQIGDKVEITVSYDTISLKDSKLYYDLFNGKEVLMLTTEQTNINNKENYVFYKFYLYNAKGKNITVYDKSIKTACKMTYQGREWELNVDKKDNHLLLTYEEGFEVEFKKLPLGLYSLDIYLGDEVIKYPLYLLGDKGVSPDKNYDLTKTYVNPTYIEGIAGEQYVIDIEFRASDNLRWNYEINLELFGVSNSYGLDSTKLKIEKKLGEKNGQMKLLVTQYVTSKEKDNVLSFTYKSSSIPSTTTLHIKCADLLTLEYHSGAVDGTVVNPSIVKFIPKDKYGNLYTDLFDETLYPKTKLATLTNGVSVEGHSLTTNNYVSDGQFLNVQYGCKKVTTIKLTCTNKLNPNTYIYKLWSGPIDPEQSYAEIEKTEGVVAGEITKLTIHPKDVYGNDVTNATEKELENFDVNYEVNKKDKEDISDSCEYYEVSSLDKYKCQANVTKAGPVEFTVDYTDKPVKCINCQFEINPDKIDFSKTKVYNKNENKEMSRTELNTLPVTILPNFELFFFDRFMNEIKDEKEVEALKVATEFIVTDVKLCVKNNGLTKLSNVCPSKDDDENEERWGYLPNGKDYHLVAINTDTKERIPFPVELTGGYNGGSPDEIDPTKTKINPTEITLVAGEKKEVDLELRTKDDERKNYWYKEPEKHIKVDFPESVKTCTYSLSKGDNPGQYKIAFNCTKKSDEFEATVTVENTKVPTPIKITVIPGDPAKSRLFYMDDKEITKSDLGKVSVEDKFQMKNKLYDKYDNQITTFNFELSTLQIKMNPITTPKSHTWSAEPVAQKNGDIIITLKSTYANQHIVTGLYFPLEQYTIVFTHGQPDGGNSISDVNKIEAYIDEEVKICITAYDKYNNYIDAKELKDNNPFEAKYFNDKNSTKIKITGFDVELFEGKNALCYPQAFTVTGITTMNGYLNDKQIKSDKSRVTIKTKDIYFLNNYVLRLESSKNAFELLKDGAKEKNNIEKPIYRLYPRDKYGNDIDVIPTEILNTYASNFKMQINDIRYDLVLNNRDAENAEYAEFVVNNDIEDDETQEIRYKTLTVGFYDLVFTDGKDRLVYNVTLTGDGKGGSNEKEDISKTAIIEQNLKYIAGQSGYMMIEIRTSSGERKNFWGYTFKVESCDENDKTFKFTEEQAGLMGVYLITVTTEKANTYPTLERCPLKIYVNNVLVEALKPEQEVSPDEVVRTEILKKYYKNDTYLYDGSADEDYVFEVRSFDKFNNLAETVQEVVGIKISLAAEEISTVTSETDKKTGYRKYTVVAHKAGKYTISTDKIGPQGLYLRTESYFIIKPGAIDLSKTIVKEKDSPIRAGSHPGAYIQAFDKYENPLEPEKYINKFVTTFIDPKNKEHKSTSKYDKSAEKVLYNSTTPVTIVGNVKVHVTYEDEEIDTSKVIIVVIPGDPDPKNSILTRETSKGVFTTYKNGESFTVDVKEYLELNVTLYDKYNNYISNIPADAKIENPLMSGNHMSEIKFQVATNDGYFGLDFNDNSAYIYIYRHLVGGTYDLTYTVKTGKDSADFKYGIIIEGGDGKHGNGPYVIEKCVLTPKETSFIAGNYETFTLELRTAEGLLYNDDIDIDKDIEITIEKEDKSVKTTVSKAGSEYGIYTITLYSEKKGTNLMHVNLADPADDKKTKKDVGPANYRVYPDKVPDKRYTVFTKEAKKTVNSEELIEFIFILADKFNNTFEERHDIIENSYLTLLNYDEPITINSVKLKDQFEQFEITLYPKYPPKLMTLNLLYNDGENRVYCFEENINITITSDLDILQTQIVSSNKEQITVGETLDMWLYTFDKKGECLDDKDYSTYYEIIVTGPMDSPYQETKTYKVRKTENKENVQCNNEYQIITDPEKDAYKYAGDYIIKVNGKDNQIARYEQVCSPLGYSLDGFLLEYTFDPNKISILDTVSFSITGTDKYGNKVTEPLSKDLTIAFTKDGKNTEFESEKSEITDGKVDYKVAIREVGPHQMHIYYKGEEVLTVNHGEDLPIFNIIPGPCRAETNDNFDLSPLADVQKNEKAYFSFQCYDIYNNIITHGGEEFTVTGRVKTSTNENNVDDITVVDNGDGTYYVNFVPEFDGIYLFNVLVGGEKYGEEIKWTLSQKECTGETSILCPNENRCAKSLIECVSPPDKCKEDPNLPFYCKVDGEFTCVKSQTDCDCPTGYIKCNIMKYCVPADRPDMCPYFPTKKCTKYGQDKVMHYDGVCRSKDANPPSQRVCPIGKVLCCDLSCKDNYDECPVTEELTGTKVRCISQEIKSNAESCPSTYACSNKDYVACSDGTCVSNEIYCPAAHKCPPSVPYLCSNNFCAYEYSDCTDGISCGLLKSLCEDSICRENC